MFGDCDAKVDDDNRLVWFGEDIVGFDVAMDDAVAVDGGEGGARLGEVLAPLDKVGSVTSCSLDEVVERFACDVFNDKCIFVAFKEFDDAGYMADLGESSAFLDKGVTGSGLSFTAEL